MPGVLPRLKDSPATYDVASSVTGGQLVEPSGGTASTIQTASDSSTTVLGVAADDAEPEGSGAETNYAYPRHYVAVWRGAEMRVTYSESVSFGAPLYAAASGQVKGTQAASEPVVGQCSEPGGVSSGGTVGRAWIK